MSINRKLRPRGRNKFIAIVIGILVSLCVGAASVAGVLWAEDHAGARRISESWWFVSAAVTIASGFVAATRGSSRLAKLIAACVWVPTMAWLWFIEAFWIAIGLFGRDMP